MSYRRRFQIKEYVANECLFKKLQFFMTPSEINFQFCYAIMV